MREQDTDTAPSRSNPLNSPRSQPYTLAQALRRLEKGPARTDVVKNPLVEGFPYINASPRTDTTSGIRATDQHKPGFQRQRTGGLFVEASDHSPPPPHSRSPSFSGQDSQGLSNKPEECSPYSEKELSRKRTKLRRKKGCMFPIAKMSVKEEGGFQQQESLTRGQKVKRHCARWWWVHLIILICIIVLVVCLVIFVAVPHIAQSYINKAELSIQGMTVSQTQSDNFTMSINSTIKVDAPSGAVIDAFDVVMYLEDWPPQTPFLRLSLPETTSAPETAINLTQFTEILDHNAFNVFNTWLLLNETLDVSVEGNTHIKVSGLSKKYPVHFKKIVNTPGLSNFNGTTVPESRITLTSDAQGDNFFGTVTIPNRSFINFEIGNASFINYMLDEAVGTVYIDDMKLAPGLNNLSMRANISQTPVLNAIQQPPYCDSGVLPFQLQGSNVTNHGQYLSYYAVALGSTNQSVDINVGADLSALGLTVQCSNTTSTKRSTVLW
ncbi:hypothetical protein VP1G_05173 [Cytospora mali]|uniref:Uncharacterized protein n=1 Tax=Cytospora mali TaxID=578113 RepID=A0A194V1T6_CYTMA|nr:hypothetical protein VP1G_05173 [Valsa mali var. pyri (nom. inval.)]